MAAYNLLVTAPHITKIAEADFPTRWGRFRIYGFEGCFDEVPETDGDLGDLARKGAIERRKESAVALVMGDIHSLPPIVRIHSQCLTGDVFGSQRCDCRQQLELALQMISDAGSGVLIYEEQEGRGIGLMAKLQAYELQDKGHRRSKRTARIESRLPPVLASRRNPEGVRALTPAPAVE